VPVVLLSAAATTPDHTFTNNRHHQNTNPGVYFLSPGLLQLLFYDMTDTLFQRLLSIQNAAARLVTGTRRFEHIQPVLRRLHWLPVRQRVDFKLATLVYQALHGLLPSYLSEDCQLTADTGRRQL